MWSKFLTDRKKLVSKTRLFCHNVQKREVGLWLQTNDFTRLETHDYQMNVPVREKDMLSVMEYGRSFAGGV